MSQLITNYDRSPLALSDVKTKQVTILNPEATEQTIVRGTVLGRLPNGNYQVLKSGATDGSQYPKGVLMYDITLAAGATGTGSAIIAGDVNSAGLVFGGSDTLATTVDDEALEDHLIRFGIYPTEVNDFTDYDNQ